MQSHSASLSGSAEAGFEHELEPNSVEEDVLAAIRGDLGRLVVGG